jgi:hypothetical protein
MRVFAQLDEDRIEGRWKVIRPERQSTPTPASEGGTRTWENVAWIRE